MFSWSFDLNVDGASLVAFDMQWLREEGRFAWAGREYRLSREGAWSGDFLLTADGQVFARATKQSIFTRTFAVRVGDRDLTLRAASWLSRRFELFERDAVVGRVVPIPMNVFAVVLPRHQKAAFPDRCVVCNAEHPDAGTRIIARDNLNGRMLWLGWSSVRVPCCRTCGVRLQLWRVWDFCRTLIIGGASLALGLIVLLSRLGDVATGLTVLGLCCVGFLAIFIWNRLFPPAFNVDVHRTYVEYEFRDESLAREFAELNQARSESEPIA